MLGNLNHLGLRGFENEFFVKTAPRGPRSWVWWTVTEQERADPASNPRAAGTPTRVRQYVYVDALTGAVTKRCTGSTPSPISC
jgi:hypothetical protein